jgi:hypothetical protein
MMSYFTPPSYSTKASFASTLKFQNAYTASDTDRSGITSDNVDWRSNQNQVSTSNDFYKTISGTSKVIPLDVEAAFKYFFSYVVPITDQEYQAASFKYDEIFEKYLIDFVTRHLLTGKITVSTTAKGDTTIDTFYSPYQREDTTLPYGLISTSEDHFDLSTASLPVFINGSQDTVVFSSWANSQNAAQTLETFKKYCQTIGNKDNPGPSTPFRNPAPNIYKNIYDKSADAAKTCAELISCTTSVNPATSYTTVTITNSTNTVGTTYTRLAQGADAYSVIPGSNSFNYTPGKTGNEEGLYLTSVTDPELTLNAYLTFQITRLQKFVTVLMPTSDGGAPWNVSVQNKNYVTFYPQFMEILSRFAAGSQSTFQTWKGSFSPANGIEPDWKFTNYLNAGSGSFQVGGDFHYVPPVTRIYGTDSVDPPAGPTPFFKESDSGPHADPYPEDFVNFMLRPAYTTTISEDTDPLGGVSPVQAAIIMRRIEHSQIQNSISIPIASGNRDVNNIRTNYLSSTSVISTLLSDSSSPTNTVLGTRMKFGEADCIVEKRTVPDYLRHWIGYYYYPWVTCNQGIASSNSNSADFWGYDGNTQPDATTGMVIRQFPYEYDTNGNGTPNTFNDARPIAGAYALYFSGSPPEGNPRFEHRVDRGSPITNKNQLTFSCMPHYAYIVAQSASDNWRINYMFAWDQDHREHLDRVMAVYCANFVYPAGNGGSFHPFTSQEVGLTTLGYNNADQRRNNAMTIINNGVTNAQNAFNTRFTTLLNQYNTAYTFYQEMKDRYENWTPPKVTLTKEFPLLRPRHALFWAVNLLIHLMQELGEVNNLYAQIKRNIQGSIEANQWYSRILLSKGNAASSTAEETRYQGYSAQAQQISNQLEERGKSQKTEIDTLANNLTQLNSLNNTLFSDYISARKQVASVI